MNYDCIIIGGGLIGVTTAYEVASRGRTVLLVEAADELASQTSFANGGMLTASMPDPWNGPGVAGHLMSSLFDPYSAMKLRLSAIPGLAFWGLKFLLNSTAAKHRAATANNYLLAKLSVDNSVRLIDELQLDCDPGTAGTLKTFDDKAAMEGPLSIARQLARHGLEFRECDADAAIKVEPQLAAVRENIAGAIYYPDDASGNARKFVLTLGDHLESMGVTIRLRSRVEKIVKANGRVVGVQLDNGLVRAKSVVVAAGNASANLVRPLGVRLSIKPAKGYSVSISTEGWNAKPGTPVVDDALHAAVVPLGDQLRIAGTAEFAGNNLVIEPERIENLFQLFGRVYPDLTTNVDRDSAIPWTGLRPMSADGVPMIGPAGPDGLWINSGHGHLGWTMALGSASLIASQIVSENPPIDPTPYQVNR